MNKILKMQNKDNFFSIIKGTDIEADLLELLDEDSQETTRHVIRQNYSLDELREYLANNMDLNDSQRNLIFKFWKTHGANIMQIIERPVGNYSQGISSVDWEIHMTTQSRHQSNI